MTFKLKFGFSVVSVFNAILWGVVFFAGCLTLLVYRLWGTVSLPQLVYFARQNCTGGVELSLVAEIIFQGVLLPLFLTVAVLWFFKHFGKGENLFCNSFFLTFYLAGMWFGIDRFMGLKYDEQYVLYGICFLFYLINQRRNFRQSNVFLCALWALGCVVIMVRLCAEERLFLSVFDFEETDFYARKYVYTGKPVINKEERRNIIVIFGESLEKRFVTSDAPEYMVLDDKEAVKFADFTEGYAQRWTQGALFSAFTGVHIHYIADFFRYSLYKKLKYNAHKDRVLMISNFAGEDFDFDTPNICYVGDILAENGYQNLFVQGANAEFSGTDNFLIKHGFKQENVYDRQAFKEHPLFEEGAYWWGIKDEAAFGLFKQKISELDKTKPFFAVLFTLDLHRGDNPYYHSDKEIATATIRNLNDFIAWFRKQDFYENTTLVILADHKRMGKGVVPGGGLYNAFFNLPKRLKAVKNINRKFNQIDVFPSLLEIAGFDLPKRKAGLGTSLFADDKTLAEKYSYEEQEEIFSKIDPFYQMLFEKKDMAAVLFAK